MALFREPRCLGWAPAILLAAATLACGPAGPEGPHLVWSDDPASLDNPFPDQRLVEAGAPRFRPGWYEPFIAPTALTPRLRRFFDDYATSAAIQVNGGVGSFGATLLRATEPLEPRSLGGHVARLQKVGSGYQVLETNVPVEHVGDALASRGVTAPADLPDFFMARPSVPLPEGADGVVVVTRGPTTVSGQALERGRAWDASKPALAAMAAALKVSEADILLALPQRAVAVTAAFDALASWADDHPAPVSVAAKGYAPGSDQRQPVGVWRAGDADWSVMTSWLERERWSRPATAVGQVVLGELGGRDLRDESGLFRADWVADPSRAAVVPLAFVLTLPAGPKPDGGWKVVIGAHGATGRNTLRVGDPASFCMSWAEALAARGLGCIGIDAPSHGSRGAPTDFFAVQSPAVIRDGFREMTFDLLQLERAIATVDVDGDGAGDLAPGVRYFGNSWGAIMGSAFIPYSRRVSAAVLNVPGAGLANVLASPIIGDLLGLLVVARTGLTFDSPEYLAAFPVIRTAGQAFFEPADAINMVHKVPPSRAVLIQEGKQDIVVPNFTTEDLARAMGVPAVIEPVAGAAPLRVLSRVDPAWYLSPLEVPAYNGHNVMWDFEPVREQALRFLESDGRELLRVAPR